MTHNTHAPIVAYVTKYRESDETCCAERCPNKSTYKVGVRSTRGVVALMLCKTCRAAFDPDPVFEMDLQGSTVERMRVRATGDGVVKFNIVNPNMPHGLEVDVDDHYLVELRNLLDRIINYRELGDDC